MATGTRGAKNVEELRKEGKGSAPVSPVGSPSRVVQDSGVCTAAPKLEEKLGLDFYALEKMKMDREDERRRQDREDRLERERIRKEEREMERLERERKEKADKDERERKEKADKDERERKEKADKDERERKEKKEDMRHEEAMELIRMQMAQAQTVAETAAQAQLTQLEISEEGRRRANEAREEREGRYEERLRKAKELMKDVLTFMPKMAADIPSYFDMCDRIFHENRIDDGLRLPLINKYLTDDARRLLISVPAETVETFEEARALILRTYKLTPGKYRELFFKLTKKPEETHSQFGNRLSVAFKYYCDSRNITSLEELNNLIIADQFKTGLSTLLREQVKIFEAGVWKPTQELAEMLDMYVSERDAYAPVEKPNNSGGETHRRGASYYTSPHSESNRPNMSSRFVPNNNSTLNKGFVNSNNSSSSNYFSRSNSANVGNVGS